MFDAQGLIVRSSRLTKLRTWMPLCGCESHKAHKQPRTWKVRFDDEMGWTEEHHIDAWQQRRTVIGGPQ
jgi:uncharacterized protein involved in type VI secretion and phage assembly